MYALSWHITSSFGKRNKPITYPVLLCLDTELCGGHVWCQSKQLWSRTVKKVNDPVRLTGESFCFFQLRTTYVSTVMSYYTLAEGRLSYYTHLIVAELTDMPLRLPLRPRWYYRPSSKWLRRGFGFTTRHPTHWDLGSFLSWENSREVINET